MRVKTTTMIMAMLFLACMLSMAFMTPVTAAPDSGIVGLWHFDKGTGSVAADSSGLGNDGTLSGGKFGNALEFDGVNDYVRVPGSTSLDITDKITVEAWIKPKSPYLIHGDIVRRQGGYQLCLLTNGKIEITLWFDGGPAFWLDSVTTIPIPATRFYHVAFTYDKDIVTNNLKIYIDGILDAQYTVAQKPITPWGVLGIGAVTDGGQYWWFTGIIDEVRISNVARTSFDLTAAPSVDGNTVALWHFDEGIGSIANDATTNNNHGTIYGAIWAGPTWVDGKFGKALSFDGINDYVSVADSASLDGIVDLTVELWLKPAITYQAGAPDFYVFVSKYGLFSFQFVYHPEGYLYLWVTGGMAVRSSSITLTAGSWYHLAATFKSGTNDSHIYVDGVDVTYSTTTQTMTTNDSPLLIGARPSPSPPYPKHFVRGITDEVRIWNRALSAEEIKTHAWGLVGQWHFDENTGAKAYDSSGFGNDGTLSGTTPPVWVAGRFGSALSFSGDDYVRVSDSSSLEPTEITVEGWVKRQGSPGAYRYIVSKYLPNKYWAYSSYGLYTGASGGLRFYIGYSTSWVSSPDAGTGVWDGKWHHVAGTFDGSNLKLYVDGVQVDGAPSTTQDIYYYETGDLFIGAYHSTGLFFSGTIDEVRIWNQALVPVKFTQTGLDNTAQGTVVTVTDPVPLTYNELPHVVMVRSGAAVGFDYTDTILSSTAEKRFKLVGVTPPEPSTTVTAPTIVTGSYKVQFKVTFGQTGLDYTATGTVVTIGTATKTKADLPLTDWFDSGTTYSYSDPVSSTVSGKRFKLTGITGPSSPIAAPGTVTGTYVTQFQVTFTQTGVGLDFTGTVVTIDGSNYAVNVLPTSFWWDKDSTHSFAFQSPLVVTPNAKQYVWTSTTGLSTAQSGSIVVSTSGSVTGNYKTQWKQTFTSSGLGADATGTLVTVTVTGGEPSGAHTITVPSGTLWVDDGATVSYAFQNPVASSTSGWQYWLSSITGPSSGYTVNNAYTIIGNYLKLPLSQVTTSNLCCFDVDDQTPGQQFRLIFTQDPTAPSTYKLTASNPGQLYYNVFYIGAPGTTASLTITIPYPFVTQGAVPIHIYSGVSIVGGCYVPSGELSGFSISGTSTVTPSGALGISLDDYGTPPTIVTITVSGTVPSSGLVYVTVHLDYGLKKGDTSYGKDSNDNAVNPKNGKILIGNLGSYAFSYTAGSSTHSQTIQNKNVFKHDPGFAGIVTDKDGNPVKGVEVQIYDPDGKLLATVYTDEDGWYVYSYKHTGKAATFTIKLPAYGLSNSVTVKANSFVVVNFQI